jgi:hypothetical protein
MSGTLMVIGYANSEFASLIDFVKQCKDGVVVEREIPNAFDDFFTKASVAAASNLGASASQHIQNFFEETSGQSEALDRHYKSIARKSQTVKPAAGDDALAKSFRTDGRRATLRDFLKTSIAKGESVEAVIAYANRTDPETARLLRELAEEL